MRGAFSSYPQVETASFISKIEAVISDLPKQEARAAKYMLLNSRDLGFQTGASIAKRAGVSAVTVSRLLHRLGYRGMRDLKREMQEEQQAGQMGLYPHKSAIEDHGPLKSVLDAEIKAVITVFEQFHTPVWQRLVAEVSGADCVFVTGFQTVRGIAEDFSRRLSLVRNDVRFLAAHDGMLMEWIGPNGKRPKRRECLIIIDVVPYAREASLLAEVSRAVDRQVVVLTDELCHWAQDYTDLIVHAPSRNGLFVESMSALAAVLNVLVHSLAENDPANTRDRLAQWQSMSRRLKIF